MKLPLDMVSKHLFCTSAFLTKYLHYCLFYYSCQGVCPQKCNTSTYRNMTTKCENINNDQYNLPLKNFVHRPFLKRKGRCLKGNRCDFFHPKRSPTPKYQIPCPF